jgi:hypothetical protein
MERTEELEAKLQRVKELVELLESYRETGFSLKLDFKKGSVEEESKWEETSRDQYDVQKYYSEEAESYPLFSP